MEVRRWRKKVKWLAKFFEFAIPMAFMAITTLLMQMGRWRIATSVLIAVGIGSLLYLGALRDIAEATWKRQASAWLKDISRCLTSEMEVRMESEIKQSQMKICRFSTWTFAMVAILLTTSEVTILSVLARAVVVIIVMALFASHLLMVRSCLGA